MSYRLRLDISPATLPSPNERLHWAAKAKRVRALRESVYVQALAERKRQQVWANTSAPCTLRITLLLGKGQRRRDIDNSVSGCKGLIDALADAGWLVDDRAEWLTELTVAQERSPDGRGAILVEITPREPA